MSRSLEEIVNTTYRRLLLIRAAVNVSDEACLDEDALADAINELTEEALEDLAPLTFGHHLPSAVAGYTPEGGAR